MSSHKRQANQNTAKNLCTICNWLGCMNANSLKTKHERNMLLAAALVVRIGRDLVCLQKNGQKWLNLISLLQFLEVVTWTKLKQLLSIFWTSNAHNQQLYTYIWTWTLSTVTIYIHCEPKTPMQCFSYNSIKYIFQIFKLLSPPDFQGNNSIYHKNFCLTLKAFLHSLVMLPTMLVNQDYQYECSKWPPANDLLGNRSKTAPIGWFELL